MKLLVVGGAGYIGSSFVEHVFNHSEYDVIVLDDLSTGFREAVHPKATFVKGSILDKAIIDKIFEEHKDIVGVFHFAAKLIVPESVKQPAMYWLNNVGGVATLLESMQQHHIKNFVFSSTAAVYGFPKTIPVDEESPTHPCNPYGSSKLACEQLIKEAAAAYDMNYIILRYFNVAGATDSGAYGLRKKQPTLLIPVINKALLENGKVNVFGNDYETTKDGTCIRDYIHIEDLVKAHLDSFNWMLENKASNTFNLGTNTGYSVLDVLKTTETTLNVKVNYEFAPRRPGDPDRLITKNDKIANIIGWTPKKELAAMIESDFTFRKKL